MIIELMNDALALTQKPRCWLRRDSVSEEAELVRHCHWHVEVFWKALETLALGERKWGANEWGINPNVIMRLFTYLRSRLFPIFARKTT